MQHVKRLRDILFAGLAIVASVATAAEPRDCVKFALRADGTASFTNICSDTMNVMYCVDAPASPRSCAIKSDRVVNLLYGATEVIAGYSGDGKGAIHSAICAFPAAPVGWKPGPDSVVVCKKTCVMC